jgi:hypothetical protein
MTLQNFCKSEQMNISIQWNTLDAEQWQQCLSKVQRPNLLQSDDYLYAMAHLNQQRLSRGLITLDGQEAGICTILEAGVFKNIIHAMLLDRGPLWFEGFGAPAHFEGFVRGLAQKYPKRFGRRIRFIPEYEDTPQSRQMMQLYGYKSGSDEGYETVWLNLRSSIEDLRKNLNPKWRNKLNQSKSRPLEIIWSNAGSDSMNFKWLISQYMQDKALRKYDGPSFKTIKALGDAFSRGKNMLIGCALLDKQPIAGILLFIHGSSATYQIGYTSDAGRENRAHYALLWNVLEVLKDRQVYDFDLGGINAEGAKGVGTFKKGIGGTIEKTLGIYH